MFHYLQCGKQIAARWALSKLPWMFLRRFWCWRFLRCNIRNTREAKSKKPQWARWINSLLLNLYTAIDRHWFLQIWISFAFYEPGEVANSGTTSYLEKLKWINRLPFSGMNIVDIFRDARSIIHIVSDFMLHNQFHTEQVLFCSKLSKIEPIWAQLSIIRSKLRAIMLVFLPSVGSAASVNT